MAAKKRSASNKSRGGTPPKKPSTTVVKISREVREYIVDHAAWNQSVDSTLRVLLGPKFKDGIKLPDAHSLETTHPKRLGNPENPKFTGSLFGLEGSCSGGFAKLFESLFGNTTPQS